jgi:uncharacterized protein (TIGR01777 family)
MEHPAAAESLRRDRLGKRNMRKRIIVTGGTGFIGKPLCTRLIEREYEVVVLSRNPEKVTATFGGRAIAAPWGGTVPDEWARYADGAHGIVNLAGDNIAAGRWNADKKKRILESRLEAGRAVFEAVRRANRKPDIVIQASAIGYYGNRGEHVLDENSSRGSGFLADVCLAWEETTRGVEASGTRRVIVRTAPVLGARGGFLDRLLPIFRRYLGGYMGNGKSWMSWMHVYDEVSAIIFLLERDDLSGVFNLSSPQPVRNRQFYQTLGKVLKRPASLPIPAFVLRAALGEVAQELILAGQRVLPKRLLEAGYRFSYPELEGALREFL